MNVLSMKNNKFSTIPKKDYSNFNTLNNNNNDIGSTKEKIKNLTSKLEDKKIYNNNNNYKIPKFNSSKNNFNIDFSSKYKYNSNNNNNNNNNKNLFNINNNKNNIYNNLYNKDDGLDGFADFSTKKLNLEPKEKSSRIRTYSSNSLRNYQNNFDFNNINSKNGKNIINENDIRNLTGKIRFLTHNDIKNMNKSTIDELLSLANTIKRIFENN